MNILLTIPIILSFVMTLFLLPYWIGKAKRIGLVWEDMNKYKTPKNVAGSGGIVVVTAFILGVLCYVAIKTFIIETDISVVSIFAMLATVTIAAMIGFVDDLFGWVHGGLSAKFRIILAIFASIPLMVINAGYSRMDIPFMGLTELGIFYSLVLIPLGVTGAVTTYNFLAGFNGLEAGQGIIILSFMSFIAYLTGNSWLAIIGLCMVVALLGFYKYNRFPARVFPGDVMTYAIGGLIAAMAILGNFEKIAVFIFTPYIIEVGLKLRGGLKKQSFGIPQKDGSLEMPFEKIYGLEHLAIWILKKIKGKAYESDVAYLIHSFQIIICILALIIFRSSLF